jgi:hypothetical protein
MLFRADALGAEVIAVVVAEDEFVGSVVDEQLAITSVTHAASPAMRMVGTNPPSPEPSLSR